MEQLFNYQLVYRCKHASLNDTTIVVTGETELPLTQVLASANDCISLDNVTYAKLENVVYQPKIVKDEQKEA